MRLNPSRSNPARILAKSVLPAVPTLVAACLVLAAHATNARAATYNWTNGVNNTGNNIFDALTTHSNWSVTPGVNTFWTNSSTNIPTFNATPSPTTITVANTTITAGGLTFNASGWILSAGSSGSQFSTTAATPFTITLATGVSASSSVAIAGGDTHGLLVTGAGTFTTTNTNTTFNAFSGGITVTNGATLSTGIATANAVLGSTGNTVILDNGTLAAATGISLARTIFLGPAAAPTGGGSVAETDASKTLTLSNPILDHNAADSLTLSAANLGTVTLSSSSNGYTGATNIQSGTLKLTGSGTISDSSQINIATHATFDVSAITNYTVANQTLTGTGGTVLGDTVLSGGSTFLANLDPASATLHFTGSLDLSAMPTLALSGTLDGIHNYTLATFTVTESGTFSPASVAALPLGYTIDYGNLFGNAITLIAPAGADPIPEPASLALLSLGAAAFLVRRRNPHRI